MTPRLQTPQLQQMRRFPRLPNYSGSSMPRIDPGQGHRWHRHREPNGVYTWYPVPFAYPVPLAYGQQYSVSEETTTGPELTEYELVFDDGTVQPLDGSASYIEPTDYGTAVYGVDED